MNKTPINQQDDLLPEYNYEILVLKAEDQSQPGSKWNHGNSYGVAIDVASSEIVYWTEKW